MDRISQEFLDSCRCDGGRVLRGDNMTRIETFVDAAFAFTFTMLVISIDEIPQSPTQLFELSRDIPAFIISASIIGSIWLTHSTWSRTFGLQDRVTVYLSLALVMLVLIFVYPIKLMAQATVLYISTQQLGIELFNNGLFENEGWQNNEVADLFIYVALGLMALSVILISFYLNALRHLDALRLNSYEIAFCKSGILVWLVVILTAAVSGVLALVYSPEYIARAGFIYFSLFFTIPLARGLFNRSHRAASDVMDAEQAADQSTHPSQR